MMISNKSNKLQSWSEINKNRKRFKKEWKEKNLEKKKQKLENESLENSEPEIEISVEDRTISTISIAVPGSILENAQSFELRTYLAGQIARAACLFQVDEIVVYDDYGDEVSAKKSSLEDSYGSKSMRNSCIQLARILQFLECPQYLRKNFFPIHRDLKFCGLLNPLNAPHHLTVSQKFKFREGIVTNKPVKPGKGSMVNVGLKQDVQIDRLLTEGLRCTVRITNEDKMKKMKGRVVPPDTPRKETGVYWGYSVRLAKSITQVFSQCPFKNGYDLTIGTSDRGSSIDSFDCSKYQHLLVMFGGVQGIEFALENDTEINETEAKLLFDEYLNTLPAQGSKTIRTEEAVLISLAALRPKLNPKDPPMVFDESLIVSCNRNTQNNAINYQNTNENPECDPLSKFD